MTGGRTMIPAFIPAILQMIPFQPGVSFNGALLFPQESSFRCLSAASLTDREIGGDLGLCMRVRLVSGT